MKTKGKTCSYHLLFLKLSRFIETKSCRLRAETVFMESAHQNVSISMQIPGCASHESPVCWFQERYRAHVVLFGRFLKSNRKNLFDQNEINNNSFRKGFVGLWWVVTLWKFELQVLQVFFSKACIGKAQRDWGFQLIKVWIFFDTQ